MSKYDTARFSGFIRNARMLAGKTQRDVAEAAGISASYLNDLELGRKDCGAPETIRRLAAALDVPYETLAWVVIGQYAARFGVALVPS